MKTYKTLYIDKEILDDMKEIADKENRSVSNAIITAILEYIKNHKQVRFYPLQCVNTSQNYDPG